jgi:hypothetical protein
MEVAMRNCLSTFVVLIGLGTTNQANAGFVTLPSTGFANSAYTDCYNAGRIVPSGGVFNNVKGNFGSFPITLANAPAPGSNDTCWVAKPASSVLPPASKTGYILIGSRTSAVPTTTGGLGDIATLHEVAWRNSATNMCIIGTQVTMKHADHDSGMAGVQHFEINDIARGGFSASSNVDVAYTIFSNPATLGAPVYRVGRTFTSVQHRALNTSSEFNGTNYLDLPTKDIVTTAYTGETGGTPPFGTTLTTQDAVVNANWIDFTTEVGYTDNDGNSGPASLIVSPFLYIEASCLTNPTVHAGAVRLRMTAQTGGNMKEISVSGYAIDAP